VSSAALSNPSLIKKMGKQPIQTLYFGLDIGKSSHAYALVDETGSTVESATVSNSERKLDSLAKRLADGKTALVVGCEATGSYYERAAIAFSKVGVEVRVINPALTTTRALRSGMRSTKTDAADALGIARKLAEKRGDIGTSFAWNPETRRLQALGRHLKWLRRTRASLKTRVKSVDERPFESLGLNAKALDDEVARVEAELISETQRVRSDDFRLLIAIRGVGELTAAKLLAEAGDLSRFPRSAAFAAFVGLDPTVRQSGSSVRGKSRMSKAGSSYLRHTFGWTAKLLVRWNPAFRARFEYDLERGKPVGVAYGIIARKFATVAFHCITEGEAFDESKIGHGRPIAA